MNEFCSAIIVCAALLPAGAVLSDLPLERVASTFSAVSEGDNGLADPPPADEATTNSTNDEQIEEEVLPGARPELTAEQETDLAYEAANLLRAQQEWTHRVTAAQRLLRMDLPQAYEVLGNALKSGRPEVMDAVIAAMSRADRPVEPMLDPAVEALMSAPIDLIDRLAFALMRFGDQAIQRIVTIVRDQSLPDGARIGAIRTLSIVPSRESAAALMAVINPAAREPDALRVEAFRSLGQLSDVDHGTEYERWRQWWTEAQRQSREEWSAGLVRRWFEHAAALEREAAENARRYVALLRELYLERPLERQFERLPLDLEDPLPQARIFALERIGVLIRDSVPIPENIQSKVIACLDHDRPEIRRRAASILVELDHPMLPELLITRLSKLREPTVAQTWLDALALRPPVQGIDTMLPWLQREATRQAAARALWSILTRTPEGMPTEEAAIAELRTAAASAWRAAPSPATARLAALLSDAESEAPLEQLLRGDEMEIARSIAEGFIARGRTAPVLAAADQDAVYPFAIRLIPDELPTIDGLRLLIELPPTESHTARWKDAVRLLLRRLGPASAAEADDLLRESGIASNTLRETVLVAALLSETPAPSAREIAPILRRLVPLLIDNGAAMRGYELLTTFALRAAPDDDLDDLDDLRLRVTLLVGRFDEAEGITNDPARWTEVLAEAARKGRDPAGAERLHAEILRRWTTEELPDALLRRLDEAKTLIGAAHARNGQQNRNSSR